MNNDKKLEYKCEVCGTSIDVSKTKYTFFGLRKGHCEQCEKIISLRDVVKRHWDEFTNRQSSNEEGEYGEWQVHSSCDGMTFTSRELDHHDDSFEFVDRTANVKQIIEDIDGARSLDGSIYYDCPYCENTGGNFYYVTEYGIKYHTKLNCSALKRTVRRELYEEVKDRYHACPKCAGG